MNNELGSTCLCIETVATVDSSSPKGSTSLPNIPRPKALGSQDLCHPQGAQLGNLATATAHCTCSTLLHAGYMRPTTQTWAGNVCAASLRNQKSLWIYQVQEMYQINIIKVSKAKETLSKVEATQFLFIQTSRLKNVETEQTRLNSKSGHVALHIQPSLQQARFVASLTESSCLLAMFPDLDGKPKWGASCWCDHDKRHASKY